MIDVNGLTFAYGASTPAISELSFSIGRGEIFGFLGPSGAGKSTTQKILMKLLPGYRGDVVVMDKALRAWGGDYFEHIGVCFEFPANYRKLSARENLRFFASFYQRETLAPEDVLERVGLGGDIDKRVDKFSKGMQIRLNLARALLHQPEIYFLDEPTAGLDPVNARNVRELILELKKGGATVFLTTHDMMVADTLCDRVGFLVDGGLHSVGAPEALRIEHGKRALRVGYETPSGLQHEEFPLDGLDGNEAFQRLLREAKIDTMHSQESSLEDVFIAVTGRSLT